MSKHPHDHGGIAPASAPVEQHIPVHQNRPPLIEKPSGRGWGGLQDLSKPQVSATPELRQRIADSIDAVMDELEKEDIDPANLVLGLSVDDILNATPYSGMK